MSDVIFIEFDDNMRPFGVVMRDNYHYDAEWCNRDRALYANMSGSGSLHLEVHDAKFWVEEGREVSHYPPPNYQRTIAPKSQRIELPEAYRGNFSEWAELDVPCEYCSVCEDWLPVDDGEPCEHVAWCDECECWHTPDEPHREGE